jgi:hypothetical protein
MDEMELWDFVDEAAMLQHCAPIFFLPSPTSGPSAIAANGTVALLDTGEKKLLLTCFHVWDEFRNYRQEVPGGCLCAVFNNYLQQPTFIPDEALIDADADLDLAVFEARPDTWSMGYKRFYRIDRWPIPKAKKGDPIAFVGFPGASRKTDQGIGDFGTAMFGLTVTDVSERKLIIAPMPGDEQHLVDNEGRELPPFDVGGLSGTPAYVRDSKARLLLVGFVQMGRTTSDALFLVHAAFLNRDGSLRR